MTKYFIIGDIHGDAKGYNALINKVKDDEKIILIGDIVSRGISSCQILKSAKRIVDEGYGVYIKGNHEVMFLNFIINPKEHLNYLSEYVGGYATLQSFLYDLIVEKGYEEDYFKVSDEEGDSDGLKEMEHLVNTIKKEYYDLLKFIEGLPTYYQDGDILCVHAGISPDALNIEGVSEETLIWGTKEFLKKEPKIKSLVIHGHTPTQNISNGQGKKGQVKISNKGLGRRISIDGGGFLEDKSAGINAVVINSNKRSTNMISYHYNKASGKVSKEVRKITRYK